MKGHTEYPEEEWLALSGIQHFAFCRRQWALIHIEQVWSENYLTTSGKLQHSRAHDYSQSELRGDLLVLRDLRVASRKLGISGDCDVVEFHKSEQGVSLTGRVGTWLPYPVEYKHGRPKVTNADRLQLCAEAACLEEMLACSIPEGALFYQEIKHREIVALDEKLRCEMRSCICQMHDLASAGHTPRVKPSKSCQACSLKELCLPQLAKTKSVKEYLNSTLNDKEV
ncbi:CRISPR-associated protein Cas4 [Alloscardovia venturai]|uniref:CRISPR-associated exonuclease Cas4 n=1 Tax=Alloscardovia venturai TaxID=1769421 RepID=A0ABW2Y3B3_9BIFI